MERKNNERQDTVTSHTLENHHKDLNKKVTLLQHFKTYLETEAKMIPEEDKVIDERGVVYVKKWMKTRHAVMFRLSNKIVQVNFTDKTEIILSSENKLVVYVNKKGERSNYPLATALESPNTEMAKRLKYTKEILTHMLTNNNGANGGILGLLLIKNFRKC
jgi:polo-like kinase 1